MKKYKFRFLVAALSVVMLAGCNAPHDSENGLIFMWFDVTGQVVDPSGNPIPGIRVEAESADEVWTDSKGKFTVHGGGVPSETTTIRCIDDDAEENGSYRTKSVVVDLEKYKEGQGWTEGYYRNKGKVVIEMTPDAEITPDPGIGTGPEAGQ